MPSKPRINWCSLVVIATPALPADLACFGGTHVQTHTHTQRNTHARADIHDACRCLAASCRPHSARCCSRMWIGVLSATRHPTTSHAPPTPTCPPPCPASLAEVRASLAAACPGGVVHVQGSHTLGQCMHKHAQRCNIQPLESACMSLPPDSASTSRNRHAQVRRSPPLDSATCLSSSIVVGSSSLCKAACPPCMNIHSYAYIRTHDLLTCSIGI